MAATSNTPQSVLTKELRATNWRKMSFAYLATISSSVSLTEQGPQSGFYGHALISASADLTQPEKNERLF